MRHQAAQGLEAPSGRTEETKIAVP